MFLLLLLCCAEAVFGASYKLNVNGTEKTFYLEQHAEDLFEQFIVDYGKQYESQEEKNLRLAIFRNQLKEINELNLKHDAIYGINQFSDLTSEEFIAKYTGCHGPEELAMPCKKTGFGQGLDPAALRSDRLDWREQNAVTPVKYQGTCSSCWAFSTIANLESQYAKNGRGQLDLSEQQLVDCEPSNRGCGQSGGGWITNGGIYVVGNGIMAESSYPYTDSKGTCAYNPSQVVARASSCLEIGKSEEELKAALTQYGPISIVIDSEGIKNYQGGIASTCTYKACNHAVLLVGYDASGSQPYWILKNSYGAGWGEQGYFKVPMGQNACGISQCSQMTLQL